MVDESPHVPDTLNEHVIYFPFPFSLSLCLKAESVTRVFPLVKDFRVHQWLHFLHYLSLVWGKGHVCRGEGRIYCKWYSIHGYGPDEYSYQYTIWKILLLSLFPSRNNIIVCPDACRYNYWNISNLISLFPFKLIDFLMMVNTNPW